uniref:Uncharacterized protein n=1 Tax=Knipowitschia caucasica TaxID=637954 RepID=A0AAV2JH10_KNICA
MDTHTQRLTTDSPRHVSEPGETGPSPGGRAAGVDRDNWRRQEACAAVRSLHRTWQLGAAQELTDDGGLSVRMSGYVHHRPQ